MRKLLVLFAVFSLAAILAYGGLRLVFAQQGPVAPGWPVFVTRPSAGSAATLLSARQVSGSNAAQTLALAGGSNQRVCLYSLALFTSAASTATLSIQDGATTIYDFGTVTTATSAASTHFNFGGGHGALCGSTGNAVNIQVGAAGVGNTSTVSAVADRQ